MDANFQEQLDYLIEQFQIGNYGRVLKYAKVLMDSDDPDAIKQGTLYCGLAYAYDGQEVEAQIVFDQLVKDFPDYGPGYYYRIDSYIRTSQFEEAKADAVKLYSLDHENPDYVQKYILVHEYLGDYGTVLEAAGKMAEHLGEEDGVDFILSKGFAHLKLGQYQAAIDDYVKLEENEEFTDNQMADLYNNVGFAYIKLAQYEDAKDYLEDAITLNNKHSGILSNLGFTLAQLDEVDRGYKLVDHAIKVDPNNSNAFKHRAKIALQLGETEAAKADLLQARALEYSLVYDDEVEVLLADFGEEEE